MPTLTPEQKSRRLRVLTVGGLFAVLLGIYVAYFAGGGRGNIPIFFSSLISCNIPHTPETAIFKMYGPIWMCIIIMICVNMSL